MGVVRLLPICALIFAIENYGFAQANQTLSNLTGPTAINTSLSFDTDNVYSVGTAAKALDTVYTNNLSSGTSGLMEIQPQSVSTGNGVELDIYGGTTNDSSGTALGGRLGLIGGNSTSGTGGYIQLEPGLGSSGVNDGYVLTMGHTFNTGLRAGPTATTCGTSPSVSGNSDVSGRVTIGTGSFSSCTLTFGVAWASTPSCTANSEKAAIALKVVPSTTTVVISAAANFAAGTVLDYLCEGFQ